MYDMPLTDRDIQAHNRTIGHHINGVKQPAIFAISQFLKITTVAATATALCRFR